MCPPWLTSFLFLLLHLLVGLLPPGAHRPSWISSLTKYNIIEIKWQISSYHLSIKGKRQKRLEFQDGGHLEIHTRLPESRMEASLPGLSTAQKPGVPDTAVTLVSDSRESLAFSFNWPLPSLKEGRYCTLPWLRVTVSLCRARVVFLKTSLQIYLVNITHYFLEPEIYNKITLSTLNTKTQCFQCAFWNLFFKIKPSP